LEIAERSSESSRVEVFVDRRAIVAVAASAERYIVLMTAFLRGKAMNCKNHDLKPVSVNSEPIDISAVLFKSSALPTLGMDTPSQIGDNNPLDWRVKKILLFIDTENGRIGPDMTEICRRLDLGISADYAVKLFRKQAGIGFREYAARRRLMQAARQLAETSLSIKVIAADLGYNSPQDFSRRFKFKYQLRPTEFRKRQHL
jgi:AraC-like DNA-binding protein